MYNGKEKFLGMIIWSLNTAFIFHPAHFFYGLLTRLSDDTPKEQLPGVLSASVVDLLNRGVNLKQAPILDDLSTEVLQHESQHLLPKDMSFSTDQHSLD